VNLKFEVFAGSVEMTSLDLIAGLFQTPIVCGTTTPLGPATPAPSPKGASPRFDGASGHYLVKWDAPSQSGTCWIVSLLTVDGSSLQATFQIR
jgi:hypothetical protein